MHVEIVMYRNYASSESNYVISFQYRHDADAVLTLSCNVATQLMHLHCSLRRSHCLIESCIL